jgi:OOP family OmpA-OmpF porin
LIPTEANLENYMKYARLMPLALLALSTGVYADNDLYVVGEVTHSRDTLNTSTNDTALTGAGASALSSNGKSNGNQWRLQLGYKLSPNVAIEGGYIDFGKAKYSASYTGGTAQGTVKAGGLDIAALGIVPVTDSISVFGKVGVVAARVKSSLTAGTPASAATGNISANAISPLIGLGASYKISDTMDVRAEYDHASDLGKSGKTGKMKADMVSVGLAYHF